MDDCIEYQGAKNRAGYGVLPKAVNGSRLAHRAALADRLGRPVVGVVRHSCDNPPCVNPDHLLEGTQRDNVNDAVERGRVAGGRKYQTHCKHGHALTEDNVQYYTKQSTLGPIQARRCVECRREQSRKTAARRKQERHERGLYSKRKATA